MYQSGLSDESVDRTELVEGELPLQEGTVAACCKREPAALVGGPVGQQSRRTDALLGSDGALCGSEQYFCAGSSVA